MIPARLKHRCGPHWLSWELGIPARTITAISRRNGLQRLYEIDTITGEVIRASNTTAVRYERDRPGELVHVDVQMLGRIPPGGGWRVHGRQAGTTAAKMKARFGYDFVNSMVDDHTRLAYSEIHDDEQDKTATDFLHTCDNHRRHHALEGDPPIRRCHRPAS